MCNQQPLLPEPHPYRLMVQTVSTNKALGTESPQHNRSVWIEGNANRPEIKISEGQSRGYKWQAYHWNYYFLAKKQFVGQYSNVVSSLQREEAGWMRTLMTSPRVRTA